ncbi:glycosyltransferase family 2 protein [Paeniglutamicibacter sp. NPDC012692]|uniref:glycosyltransferase family 2 protein n=1 Tax=Paeniglutamicibacter sp. NPDC012692 TaxID=3364388 RepID=UPI0036C8AA2E
MDITDKFGSAQRKFKQFAAQVGQLRIVPSDTGPTSSAQTARVAVVIPVFNAVPYLQVLLDSLAAQDLDPTLFEVIAVDDGSTDGGGQLLDIFAARHPNWRVIRQRNSGWPGKPRNVGIESSVSDYIFFCDADDIMGPESLRRMLDFADEHQVDVLAPRMVGIGGRGVNSTLFAKTLVDTPIRQIMATLTPQKLIRRELLAAHGIRFPLGKVRLEDGMMLARCYLSARRISILADYDYYFIRTRDNGTNISSQGTVPEKYTDSVLEIARIIKDTHPDAKHAELLVLDLYQRKLLRSYVPARFRGMSPRVRDRWVKAHARFVSQHIPLHLEEQLGFPFRQRSELVRGQDVEGLLRLAATEEALRPNCRAALPQPGGAELRVQLEPKAKFESAHLLARARGKDTQLLFELRPSNRDHVTHLPASELASLGKVIVDLYVQLRLDGIDGNPRRLLAPEEGLPAEFGGKRLYATVQGNLSLDQRN